MNYEEADRLPVPQSGTNRYGLAWDAITATATSGKAVRVPLNGHQYDQITKAIRAGTFYRGYRVHIRRVGDPLIVWCERR